MLARAEQFEQLRPISVCVDLISISGYATPEWSGKDALDGNNKKVSPDSLAKGRRLARIGWIGAELLYIEHTATTAPVRYVSLVDSEQVRDTFLRVCDPLM